MSDIPPAGPTTPPPYPPYNPDPGYTGPAPSVSSMAMTSMILGIISIVTGCFGIGVILGIVALILGIISLVSITREPQRLGGKGFAITGIVTGGIGSVLMIPLLIAILLPSLGRAREMANRGTCAANLRGIVQSMNLYSASEYDVFPLLPYAPFGPGNSGTYSTARAGSSYEASRIMFDATSPVKGAPLAGPWIMVLDGSVSAKQFLCKSDPHATAPAVTNTGGAYHINFPADDNISYSFAYPYTREGATGGWWKSTADASIPIGADMNPLNGTGRPPRDTNNPTGGKASNSNNHQGEGQNVVFSDAHAEFVRRLDVGQNNDNIYTYSGAKGGSPRGIAPTQAPIEIESSPGNSDIVMVPVRNLDTGKLWK